MTPKSAPLAQKVSEELISYIMEQDLKAGDRLPNEYALARILGVGRGTVREAVKALITRNVLENLARLGVRTRLVSAVGADLYGEMVLRQSAAAGIDISEVLTVPGEASSCYISVLDQKGDMLVAMSDMGILSHVTPELVRSLGERLRSAAAVVCDPCLPSETVAAVIREAGDTPVFLDPVSTSYARKVRPLAGGLFCLKPNRIELGVLADIETDSPGGIERAC